MSLLSRLFGRDKKAVSYPQDSITARDGKTITFTFYAHASVGIEWNGVQLYLDPVGDFDWQSQPKADVILVSHSHYDHLEMSTIEQLQTPQTVVVCDKTSADAFEHDCITMLPGSTSVPVEGVTIRAVAAYNTTEGHTDFHPQSREDCGYIVTIGGTSIYLAGDTEDNEDVMAVTGVDVAFLPVNQPYTMTPEQATMAVTTLCPKIYYPYHYGQVDNPTDVEALAKTLESVTDVRIRPLA